MFLPYLSLTLFPVTCFQLFNIPSCIMNLRKMKLKKGNTQMEFKYLVFARANANAWQMLIWPENLLKREFDVAVLMVRGISLEKGFWMVKIWQTPVGKRFKRSTLNFTYTFLTGCFTKTHPVFSNNESFIFYCNNSTRHESAFWFKNIWKENRTHRFVCRLVGYTSVQINSKLQSCSAEL